MAKRTLTSRLAWSVGLAVAAAGLVVALVSNLLTTRILREREDEHLTGAAQTLALELSAQGADPVWIAEDETRELAHTGMAVAIYEGTRRIAGDAAVALASPGTCESIAGERTCAVPAGRWTAVIARSPHGVLEARRAVLVASAAAVALTTLVGAGLALLFARWVLGPLERLRRAVERVPEDHAGNVDLGAPENITEIDALRDALEATLNRLEISLGQSRRFARDAAHELRTPLATMLGELELAEERLQGEAQAAVGRARRVGARLATLIERLLILARVEREPLDFEEVKLVDLIEEACERLRPEHKARVDVECGEVALSGDWALLLALLNNALENALKFSTGRVRIEIQETATHVLLAVEDSGPGVPALERERVFSPFYRSASVRGSIPGHGLGLALIRHVTALHGGSAEFVSVSQGARLEVRFANVRSQTPQ